MLPGWWGGGAINYMYFRCACQSPFYAMFQPLARLPTIGPLGPCDGTRCSQWMQDHWAYTFEAQGCYCSDLDFPKEVPEGLAVLPQCVRMGPRVLSDAQPIAFAKWLTVVTQNESLRPGTTEAPRPQEDDDKEVEVPLDQLYPWLKDIDNLDSDPSKPISSSASTSKKAKVVDSDRDSVALSEDQMNQVFALLEQKRRAWGQALPEQVADFRTWMPGGAFMQKTKGQVAYVLQAEARTKGAKEWVAAYMLPKLASFTLSKYGEGPASSLAISGAGKCNSCTMCGAAKKKRATSILWPTSKPATIMKAWPLAGSPALQSTHVGRGWQRSRRFALTSTVACLSQMHQACLELAVP